LWCTISYPPTEKEDDVKKIVEEHIKKAADSDHWLGENPPEIEWGGVRAIPAVIDSNHPITKMTAKYIEEIAGVKPFIGGFPIQCDFRLLLRHADTNQVLFGPLGQNLHCAEENVDIESLIEVTKIVALILADWCGYET
jgi:acetylornithine deacetylase